MPSTESEKQFMDLSRSLDSIVGELKKMNIPSIKEDIKKQGDIIERSLGNVKGSFRKGGRTKEDGDFLVGENGPEVVSLSAGSSVIPLDVSDLVDGLKNVSQLKDDLNDKILHYDKSKKAVVTYSGDFDIDFLKSQIEKQIAEDAAMDVADDGSGAKAVSALGKLQERVKKSSVENKEGTVDQGINKKNGPSPEGIKAERERLLSEDPEFYSDPKNLQEELDSYISSYNFGPGFAFNKTEEPGLSKKEKSKSKEESAEKAVKEKTKSKEESAEKSVKEKPKKEKKEKGEGGGLFSKVKSSATEKATSGSSISSGISLLEKKTGLSNKAVDLGEKFGLSKEKSEKLLGSANKGAAKSIQALAKKASQPKSEDDGSKVVSEKPNLNPPPKPAPPAPEAKAAQTSASTPENTKPSKTEAPVKSETNEAVTKSENSSSSSASKPTSSDSQMSKDDINDIKNLLSKMANALAGPLNINPSDPFRPDSRRI